MQDEFAIEELGAGSAQESEGFLELLTAYLGPVARARHRWLYRQNPHGVARTFVARHLPSGQLVGCTSLFPRQVTLPGLEGPTVLAALGGDAYVLPQQRRRGLARRLHEASLAVLGRDVAFMFGPPAEANLRVLKRIGALEARALRHFSCPVRGAWLGTWLRQRAAEGTATPLGQLLRLVPPDLVAGVFEGARRVAALRFALQRRRSLLPVPRIDERFDDLWQRARPRGAVCPVRDRAYLQWRFLDAPGGQGGALRVFALPAEEGEARLSAYCVVSAQDGRLLIHDLLAEATPDVVALGAALQDLARREGLDLVSLRLDPQGPYVGALLYAGFLPTRHPVPFQILAPVGDAQAARAAAAPWLFALGDEDWSGAL